MWDPLTGVRVQHAATMLADAIQLRARLDRCGQPRGPISSCVHVSVAGTGSGSLSTAFFQEPALRTYRGVPRFPGSSNSSRGAFPVHQHDMDVENIPFVLHHGCLSVGNKLNAHWHSEHWNNKTNETEQLGTAEEPTGYLK